MLFQPQFRAPTAPTQPRGPRRHVAGTVEEGGLGRQTPPLRRRPPAVPPRSPTVRPDSAPCSPQAGTAPTLRPLPPSVRPLPAPRVPRPRRSSLSVQDTRPRSLAGRRAPGPEARGPGVPGWESNAPSPRAPLGTRCRATHLVAPSRQAAGPVVRPASLAPGPGSRRRRRRRLLLQEGAESSDFLLEGQLPPIDHTQRASSRQHPSQPLSLPPCLRPRSLAPPRVRSGSQGRAPGGEAGRRCAWGLPRRRGPPGVPGSPRPRAPDWRAAGAGVAGDGGGRAGKPQALEIPNQGLSFLTCKKGGGKGWTSWRWPSSSAFVIFESLDLKSKCKCVCVSFCGLGTQLL